MTDSPKRTRTRVIDAVISLLMTVGLLSGACLCAWPEMFPTAQRTLQKNLRVALRDRQQTAVQRAAYYREAYPNDPIGIWFMAEALAQQGDHDASADTFQLLPQDSGLWEFQREYGMGQRFFANGNLTKAERHLRRAVELNPDHLDANNRLGHLLQACGRAWESSPFFFVQIRRGKCRGDELLAMAATDRFFRFDERLERMGEEPGSEASPIQIAAARRAIFENRESDAERILRDVLAVHPEFGEAQGRLGRIIVERGDLAEFLSWRGGLPDEARKHPEVKFVEGLEARRLGLMEGAVHCFLETLNLSPNHLGANLQIAGCLDQLNQPEIAREFAKRAELMSSLEQNYNILRTNFGEQLAYKAIDTLDAMGRPWEAAGWSYVLTRSGEPAIRAKRELNQRLRNVIHLRDPNIPGQLPTRRIRAADFPSPRWPVLESASSSTRTESVRAVTWRFTEDAEKLGIRFRYFEGTNESNRLTHIFNVMGGGMGVIDYDADGWPDLYLAQANNWKDKSPQPEWIDRLYRNTLGEQFVDVTNSAGLNEMSFSHGVTVGDYDQDGFADVYVGNLGPNTLYRNNGDGTFANATLAAGVGGNEWSTSSAFADFNRDGLPDLFVLNYTLMRETEEKECPNSAGEPRACTPDLLNAEHDRCYINLGDGSFRDVSASSGILIPDGKGLGIIVWDYGGDGRLGAFIANDTTPNFLFLNRGLSSEGWPVFSEEGLVRGVAFDQDGNAQASMGVGSGDANGDGRLDLFITNFFGDSNTLYIGQDGGTFADLTRPFRLRDPGFWMLGFGCQFADFDGDRWEDLIATNGHVDQRTSMGTEDRMPPQLFRNLTGRHFAEIPAEQLGTFFQGKYLGRGLALLDWNRDGRIDFGVSHLHSPFALVTNRIASDCRSLVVRLVGRRGGRDPIGATLVAKSRGESVSRFMTAGDGFLVSNERLLHLAWPGVSQFDELTVHWPGGRAQTWKNVDTGQEVLLIEDNELPVRLRAFENETPAAQ